jgi:two-component system osmolarity sensor histidine kinase EnvZ
LGHAAITIALTLSLFLILSTSAIYYFIVIPMAKRSAEDFAAEIVSAAHLFQVLPEEMHQQIKDELLHDHGLIVAEQESVESEDFSDALYLSYFRESLQRHAGRELLIVEAQNGALIWVDVPVEEGLMRFGFDKQRLGTNMPVALILVIIMGVILTMGASLFEVHRVTKPLNHIASAVRKVSEGQSSSLLPEEGPDEIAALAKAFNKMSSNLRQLSENRTVMIAGISHDLRTPLTRLELAVEMLDDNSDKELISRIRRNLNEMDSLIGQFLQFSRGIEDACPVQVDLWNILESLATDLSAEQVELHLHRCHPPCVYFADPDALRRVLSNLLTNAVHYGGGRAIDVYLRCSEEAVTVEICDRGPGIPAEKTEAVFRPFHRLETARNVRSGGSGLGLAIARQLALKHGWTISLLSREGGGTIAKLELSIEHRFGLNE